MRLCIVLLTCIAAAGPGCSRREPVAVPVIATLDGSPIECQTPSVTRLALYFSDVKFQRADGRWQAAALVDRSPVQGGGVALVQVLPCTDRGAALELVLPDTETGGLGFTVGVPAELNHDDPMRAAEPLNFADMFWTWQQGYKFINLEGKGADGDFVLHLGSTGCVSPAPVRPPVEPCTRPNRMQVRLPAFDLRRDTLVLELGAMIRSLEGNRCTGNYHLSSPCRDALHLLGLNAETGLCDQRCGEALFSVRQP